MVFGNESLNEFLSVIKRPKFRRFFSQKDTEGLIASIKKYSEFVEVKSTINVCRDIKDDFLLALAKDSDSDFLITGDEDLLERKKFERTKILTMAEYLKIKDQEQH